MKENTRIAIKANTENRKAAINEKEIIRKEIDEIVEELLSSEIVKKLKQTGKYYIELDKMIDELASNGETLIEEAHRFCKHPIVCRTGYQRHNDSNKIVPASRENAEYGSVKCLECGKNIHTLTRKESPDHFDDYIYIQDYLKKQSENNYQQRPIIDIPNGLKFSDIYEEYQNIMFKEEEDKIVQKILTKYKKSGR